MRKILGYLLLLLLLCGCSTIPEPQSPTSNLLIGTLVFKCSGFEKSSTPSFNGEHRSGLEIVFKNTETNQSYSLRTDDEGDYFSDGIVPGNYRVESITYSQTEANSSSYVSMPISTLGFTVQPSIVSIMYSIILNAEYGGASSYKINISTPEKRKSEFSLSHPKSKWNSFDWQNVAVILGKR
ncbi:MAG: carboxypeptidase-like regulatory domain-containing protein [Spirochaetes bacterium]|nr:carboxypeptidase-like regulatory domain-containing protein [Spirochaetota bacterium]